MKTKRKNIFKSLLALMLAFIMLLGAAPLSALAGVDFASLFAPKAEAEEVSDLPESFDLDVYSANIVFRDHESYEYGEFDYLQYCFNTIGSPAGNVYRIFSDNKDFVNSVEAYEAVKKVANPSNVLKDLNLQQRYEAVLYTVLFSSLYGEKLQKVSYSNAISDITGFTDKLINTPRTAVMFNKSSLDPDASDALKDTALAFITDGKDDKWASLSDYNGMVKKVSGSIDKVIGTATDIYNYAQKIGMYCALVDVGADAVRVLLDMKKNTTDVVLKSALQAVADSLSQDWYGVAEKVVLDVGFSVTDKAIKSLVEYGWLGCCEICPFLKGMMIGEKIGTAVCNLLFATDETIEQYEYLKIVTRIEDAAHAGLTKLGNAVDKNNNVVNASSFWFSLDFAATLYEESSNASIEFMYICYTKGLVNKIANFMGAGRDLSAEEFETSINHCNELIQLHYGILRDSWRKYIGDDYPGFLLTLQKREAGFIPITSISVSKKNVTYYVGETAWAPSVTKNPSNANGGIAYKSDNEEVFASTTGFPIDEAKKAGTANVTVYSVDNPSIYDTFTVTVIEKIGETETKTDNGIIDSGTCGENLTWKLTEAGTLIISGTGAMTNYETSSWAGAPWRNYRDNITKVVISNGVTSIGDSAFYNYGALENIIFGNNVVSIGKDAFRKCKSLTRLVFPQSLKSIGENAFVDCTGLTSITLNNMEDINEIRAFYNCEKLANLIIGRNVNVINNFIATDYLSNITVETGNEFFSSKDGVLFDKQQKELIYYPKKKVDSTYVIPNTVTRIGKGSFPDCSNLISLTIPDSVTNIDCTLDGEKLTEVSLPCGVARSKDSSCFFNKSDNLERITITSGKNGVISAGMYTFIGKAKQLVISEGVTKICTDAFFSSDYLESVIFPLSMKEIEPKAFRYCKKLKDIVIPGDIAEIYNPFGTDTEIENITISDGCNMIKDNFLGSLANSYYGIKKITISSSVDEINEKFDWKNLERIEVDSNNKHFSSDENGVLYNKDKTKLIRFPSGSLKSEYTIPDSVVSICDYAFYDFDNNCEKLTRVTIPDSVISIGNEAFYDRTSLTSVTLGNGVTSIGDWAFHGCTGLTGITIPDSVTSIGQRAFQDCTGLTSVTIGKGVKCIERFTFSNCSNLMSVTIPNSVTSIRENAFEDCTGLTSVTLGNSVTSIGYGAFRDCTGLTSVTLGNSVTSIYEDAFEACQSLKDVYYLGTEAQWENITIGSNNDYLTNATIHFNWKPCTHKWSTWKTVTAPTVDSEGLEKRVCSKCGAEETRAISKLEPVQVTSIKLNKSKKSLNIGDTFTLTATVKPNNATDKSVTWSSSNTSVATVDENGVVTAVAEGTATITATASNGVEASCTVTVKQKGDSFFKKILNVILAPFRAIINLFKKLFGK